MLTLKLVALLWLCLIATIIMLAVMPGRPRATPPKGGEVVNLEEYRARRAS